MAGRRRRVTIALDPAVIREVDKIARAMKRSRSMVIEGFVQDGLEDSRLGLAAFTNPVFMGHMWEALKDREALRVLLQAMGQEVDEAKFQQLQGLFAMAAEKGGKP